MSEPRFIIYSHIGKKFHWLDQKEWDEDKGKPEYVLIRESTYSLDWELDSIVNALNRAINLIDENSSG